MRDFKIMLKVPFRDHDRHQSKYYRFCQKQNSTIAISKKKSLKDFINISLYGIYLLTNKLTLIIINQITKYWLVPQLNVHHLNNSNWSINTWSGEIQAVAIWSSTFHIMLHHEIIDKWKLHPILYLTAIRLSWDTLNAL